MSVVDFEAWAVEDLILPFGGETYTVPPPTVGRAKMILASAIRAEVNLGLKAGPVPEEIEKVLATIGGTHPALTETVYDQMVADDVPAASIDRMSYFAVFYWARGAEYATAIAKLLWGDPAATVDENAGGEEAAPKG